MTSAEISDRKLWQHVRNYRNLRENDAELQKVLTDYFAQRGIKDEEHVRMHLEMHQLLRDEIQAIRTSPRAQQLREREWQRWIPLLGLKRQIEDGWYDSMNNMSKACNSDSHRHTNDEILEQIYGRPYNMANGVYNMVAASAVFFGAVTAVSSLVEKLF